MRRSWGELLSPVTSEDQQLFFPSGSSPAPCLDDTSRINNSRDPKSRSQHALHFCLALGAGKALSRLQEDSMGIFFFSLCARPSCDIKPTACYRLGWLLFFFFFHISPTLLWHSKRVFSWEEHVARQTRPQISTRKAEICTPTQGSLAALFY